MVGYQIILRLLQAYKNSRIITTITINNNLIIKTVIFHPIGYQIVIF